ncbi:hypothetical protein J6590_066607, partial [Homalodisca vitripennis]
MVYFRVIDDSPMTRLLCWNHTTTCVCCVCLEAIGSARTAAKPGGLTCLFLFFMLVSGAIPSQAPTQDQSSLLAQTDELDQCTTDL